MTKQGYRDRIYRVYASATGSQGDGARHATSAIRALEARVSPWLPRDKEARCIDVGCGSGMLLSLLKSLGYLHVEGVDRSAEQVENARRASLSVHLEDATAYLAARPGSFDLVTAMDLVEHFNKDELLEFLDAAHCALKAGGRLIVQTPNAGSPWAMKVRYGDLTHELALDIDSLAQALGVCGFRDLEARECAPYPHGVRSVVRWLGWKLIHAGLRAWNLIETGSSAGGIYTRVFIAKADKPRLGMAGQSR